MAWQRNAWHVVRSPHSCVNCATVLRTCSYNSHSLRKIVFTTKNWFAAYCCTTTTSYSHQKMIRTPGRKYVLCSLTSRTIDSGFSVTTKTTTEIIPYTRRDSTVRFHGWLGLVSAQHWASHWASLDCALEIRFVLWIFRMYGTTKTTSSPSTLFLSRKIKCPCCLFGRIRHVLSVSDAPQLHWAKSRLIRYYNNNDVQQWLVVVVVVAS